MNYETEKSSNLVQKFLQCADRYGSRQALLYKSEGKFKPISWHEWAAKVRSLSLSLSARGVSQSDAVGILSENRPEWTFADLATLSLGAAVVPIYPTSSSSDISHIIKNSRMRWIFVSSPELVARLKESIDLTLLNGVVVFDSSVKLEGPMIRFNDLLVQGDQIAKDHPDRYRHLVEKVQPHDMATIIYTSGTTGPPKGVVLTHDNFYQNFLSASEIIQVYEHDVALSFLPLSHVFERLAGYYFMVFSGATIAYAENMQSVPEDMAAVRPTVMAAVPRFYEKIYARILEKIQSAPPLRKKIFLWAERVARQACPLILESDDMPLFLKVEFYLASKLVLSKIKANLGGRLRFFISGGAPLNKNLAEFFYSAGILILEGYGLTETSPVIAVNAEKSFKFGTVGKPLHNCDVKIAEDGEILTQGPCVMKGYFNDPVSTAEAIQDGWFHTGDLGLLDEQGYLKITGRKKDIIVNAGGKKVAPQNLEKDILTDPVFVQAVVLGDKRHFLTALIVPNKELVLAEAKRLGLAEDCWEKLVQSPEIYRFIAERLRPMVVPRANFEQIKYFALLPNELTTASGDLTPTLKIKRKTVCDKYQHLIDFMYEKQPKHQAVL